MKKKMIQIKKIDICNKLVERFDKSENWIKSINKSWEDIKDNYPKIYAERINLVSEIEELQEYILNYYKSTL